MRVAVVNTTRRVAWQARYARARARKVLPVPGMPMNSGLMPKSALTLTCGKIDAMTTVDGSIEDAAPIDAPLGTMDNPARTCAELRVEGGIAWPRPLELRQALYRCRSQGVDRDSVGS